MDPWAAYEDLDPRGNVFVQGYGDGSQPPRYGHGGTESPSERRARRERERRAFEKAEKQREAAREYANNKRMREERRKRVIYPEQQMQDSPADDPPKLPEEIAMADLKSEPQPEPTSDIEPVPEIEPKPEPEPTPEPTPEPKKQVVPYGRPVPGQKDRVYSPHAPDAGYVDVSGIKPGTLVKCPFTKKNFRVP